LVEFPDELLFDGIVSFFEYDYPTESLTESDRRRRQRVRRRDGECRHVQGGDGRADQPLPQTAPGKNTYVAITS
jgi:hypothetical protein